MCSLFSGSWVLLTCIARGTWSWAILGPSWSCTVFGSEEWSWGMQQLTSTVFVICWNYGEQSIVLWRPGADHCQQDACWFPPSWHCGIEARVLLMCMKNCHAWHAQLSSLAHVWIHPPMSRVHNAYRSDILNRSGAFLLGDECKLYAAFQAHRKLYGSLAKFCSSLAKDLTH